MSALWLVAIGAFVVMIAAAALVGWSDGRQAARIERRLGARKDAE